MPTLRRSSLLALGAGLLAGSAGCLSSNVTGTGTNTVATSNVRIVQVVGDAPNGVDVAVNGTTAVPGLPFGDVFPNPQGQYAYAFAPVAPQLSFVAAGGTTAFYTSAASALVANGYFTIIVYGRATPGAMPAGTAAILADTTANSASTVLVRVFDALDYVTTGAGTTADVYVYTEGSPRPTVPAAAGIAYGSRSRYVSAAPGNLRIDVFAAGAASTGTPLFTTTLAANGGAVRTLVLRNPAPTSATGTAGAVLILTDQP